MTAYCPHRLRRRRGGDQRTDEVESPPCLGVPLTCVESKITPNQRDVVRERGPVQWRKYDMLFNCVSRSYVVVL